MPSGKLDYLSVRMMYSENRFGWLGGGFMHLCIDSLSTVDWYVFSRLRLDSRTLADPLELACGTFTEIDSR